MNTFDIVNQVMKRRFTIFFAVLIVVLSVGVTGYMLIKLNFEREHSEGVELFIDGIYWTVITITTLGSYPSNVALSSVVGKIFTVIMVIMGIGLIIVALPIALSPWFENRLKEVLSTKRVPIPTSNHVIICGYTDVGKEVMSSLKMYDVDYVVIEHHPSRIRDIIGEQVPSVIGDPTKEAVLRKAGIDRAIALIAVGDDRTNAFVALTASRIRPDLRIVTTIQDPSSETIMKRAGATHVLASKATVGEILAAKAMGKDPDVSFYASMGDLRLSYVHVSEGSSASGKSLSRLSLSNMNIVVVGVWRHGIFHVDPRGWVLQDGDIVLLLGKESDIEFIKGIFQV